MDSRRGGHSKGKHGTQVTPQQHEDRLRTGRDPQTGKIPLDKKGKPRRPKESSGFDTNEKHLEALGKADKELEAGLASGKYKVGADGKVLPVVKVSVPKSGTSYSLNPPKDPNGTITTKPTNHAEAYYRYDPKTGKYELITLYPTP